MGSVCSYNYMIDCDRFQVIIRRKVCLNMADTFLKICKSGQKNNAEYISVVVCLIVDQYSNDFYYFFLYE